VRRIYFDTAGNGPVCKGVFFEDGYSGALQHDPFE
jgi:hypothetical protein